VTHGYCANLIKKIVDIQTILDYIIASPIINCHPIGRRSCQLIPILANLEIRMSLYALPAMADYRRKIPLNPRPDRGLSVRECLPLPSVLARAWPLTRTPRPLIQRPTRGQGIPELEIFNHDPFQ
jgi:hypothetical protein